MSSSRSSVSCSQKRDQPAVGRVLLAPQLFEALAGHVAQRVQLAPAPAAVVERVQIVPVDREDVVQGQLDRGEEAGALGAVLGFAELRAGLEQPVVGPGIVARHGAKVLGERAHGGSPLPADDPGRSEDCPSGSDWLDVASPIEDSGHDHRHDRRSQDPTLEADRAGRARRGGGHQRGEKPVARLVPYVQELPKRGFGSMRGKAWLDESFWEPLPDEELEALGGWLATSGSRSGSAPTMNVPRPGNKAHATLSGL